MSNLGRVKELTSLDEEETIDFGNTLYRGKALGT